jgi:hypothetical protein
MRAPARVMLKQLLCAFIGVKDKVNKIEYVVSVLFLRIRNQEIPSRVWNHDSKIRIFT